MKKKNIKELRANEIGQLNKLVAEKKLEIIKVKAQMAAHKEKNLKSVRNLRKDLAQILTIIGEKELLDQNTKNSPSQKPFLEPRGSKKPRSEEGGTQQSEKKGNEE